LNLFNAIFVSEITNRMEPIAIRSAEILYNIRLKESKKIEKEGRTRHASAEIVVCIVQSK